MKEPLVRMVNICKSFGRIRALDGVDFTVGHSEIVGLVGDNGAGKSTLIKILSGIYPANKGEIYFGGRKVKISNPKDAMRIGIETIYQDQALVDQMNVPRNFFMGMEIVKSIGPIKLLDMKKMDEESTKTLEKIGLHLKSINTPVKFLSGGERQGVAIGRALHFKAKLIIMDEPTMALSVLEAKRVLQFVKQLKRQGVSCIFITHNLYHVYPIADRFVILRHGKKVGDVRKKTTSINKLIKLIIA